MLGLTTAGTVVLFAPPAVAAMAAAPPAEVRTLSPELEPAGSSRLTVWGFDVYDASLWVGRGFRADRWSQRPLALELRYLRSFTGADIAERSLDEMRRASPLSPAQGAQWLGELRNAFPDVKKGDRLVGLYEPGGGVRFFHNGRPTAEVRDAEFAQQFFAIWLGPRTSEPGLRDALLAPAGR